MERLKQRFIVAQKAAASFQEALRKPPATLIERDAAIQRFEYTVEAIWRVAQRCLNVVEGLEVGSPKAVVRMSREAGLLTDEQATKAFEMMDDRNLTVHTYNEPVAQKIFERLPSYAVLVEAWLANIGKRLK
jgi:nucleotidyltransferase substrate binding protein (TIGR01987 family)